jgi:hypothetical protein
MGTYLIFYEKAFWLGKNFIVLLNVYAT